MGLFGGTTLIAGRVAGAEIVSVSQRVRNEKAVALHLVFFGKPNQTITFPLKYAGEFLKKLGVNPNTESQEDIRNKIYRIMQKNNKEIRRYKDETNEKKIKKSELERKRREEAMRALRDQLRYFKKDARTVVQGFVGRRVRLTLS